MAKLITVERLQSLVQQLYRKIDLAKLDVTAFESEKAVLEQLIQELNDTIGNKRVDKVGEPGDLDYVAPVAASGIYKYIDEADKTVLETARQEIKSAVSDLIGGADDAYNTLKKLQDLIESSDQDLTGLLTLVNQISESLTNTRQELIDITDALEVRIATLEASVADHDTRLTNVEDKQTELENAIADKADAVHTHEADEIVESEEKQFVSAAKKEQYDENTIYNNDMAMVNALGGLAAGTTFDNVPVKDVLTKLLYPYVAPQYSVAGTPNGGTYEKGNHQTITNVRVVVTKKSEKITKVEVLDGSTVLGTKEGAEVQNGGTFNFTVSVPVQSVNKQLTARITDAAGKSYTTNTGAFNFVYPYYIGVCANDATIDEALVKGLTKKIEGKGNKSHAFNCNFQRMVFAYPKAHGALRQILDPNNFDVTGTFGRQEMTITGLDGTAQDYYVYVNSASTVSNFTVRFNY